MYVLLAMVVGPTQSGPSAHAGGSQGKRTKLVLSLALDRSGSMNVNGGCSMLPPAAYAFVDFFKEGYDRMSLSTYASDARVDVPMTPAFKAPIHAAVPVGCTIAYSGFTFMDGGLTLAGQQNAAVVAEPGEDLVKVVVLFTDGLANTIHIPNFDCSPVMSLNLTGSDAGSNPLNEVVVLDRTNGNALCSTTAGATFSCCPNLITFPSVNGGRRDARDANLVRAEARDRALATARSLRQQGNRIYAIGMGSNLDAGFLRRVANDPALGTGNYFGYEPQGEFLLAPTAAELEGVFLRLARSLRRRARAPSSARACRRTSTTLPTSTRRARP